MIPQNIVSAGKAALQMFRDDRARVLRLDTDQMSDVEIYAALPCHLSRTALAVQIGENDAGQTNVIYTLHVDDTTDIRSGDKITVTHKGQTITGIAGRPLVCSFSLSTKLESVEAS